MAGQRLVDLEQEILIGEQAYGVKRLKEWSFFTQFLYDLIQEGINYVMQESNLFAGSDIITCQYRLRCAWYHYT